MKIAVENLMHGQLHPLFWGMSEMDFITALPGANEEIQELKRLKYPMLSFDNIEFYFGADNYNNLDEIIIQIHQIKPDTQGEYFEFNWVNNALIYMAVKSKFLELKWPFEEQISKHGKTPLLIVNQNVVFAFYNDNECIDHCSLCKIVVRIAA